MREILFRGKRLDTGEWVEGDLVRSYLKMGNACITDFSKGIVFGVDNETVGQYIGLNDKNGKRIFEGDIVNIEYTETTVDKAVITYIGASFYGNRYDDCWELDGYTSLEVIGNIFDTPEIVEE